MWTCKNHTVFLGS